MQTKMKKRRTHSCIRHEIKLVGLYWEQSSITLNERQCCCFAKSLSLLEVKYGYIHSYQTLVTSIEIFLSLKSKGVTEQKITTFGKS